MLRALIADIHGNYPALESVLAYLDQQAITEIFCLGDIVGYAAQPVECVELIQKRRIPAVLGNHDAGMTGMLAMSWFNAYAQTALLWTMKQVSESVRDFLLGLPICYRDRGIGFAHGSWRDPERFSYLMEPEDTRGSFRKMREEEISLCFVAHTHRPGIFVDDGKSLAVCDDREIVLKKANLYIINVGSVGQPRDSDPRACCCIYNSISGLVQLVRLPYDVQAAQERILAAGLPSFLAARLAEGR